MRNTQKANRFERIDANTSKRPPEPSPKDSFWRGIIRAGTKKTIFYSWFFFK